MAPTLRIGDTVHVKHPDGRWTVDRVGLTTIAMTNVHGTTAIVRIQKITDALAHNDIEIVPAPEPDVFAAEFERLVRSDPTLTELFAVQTNGER